MALIDATFREFQLKYPLTAVEPLFMDTCDERVCDLCFRYSGLELYFQQRSYVDGYSS